MAVIGIDLGTTYSAAARFINGQTELILLEGNTTLPSVVSVLPSGKIAVGWTAKRNQAKNPQDTIVEVKRRMGHMDSTGKPDKVTLGQKDYMPQEVSAMVLRRIRELAEEQLGEPIDGVVISCPAYFKDPQRQATAEAGKIAGLNVLQIVNEPTAAAYAYGLGQTDDSKEHLAMVYDLGGGTFDVTVIKMMGGSLEVIGTGGDPELGGGNFDDCIVNWMVEQLKVNPNNREYIAALNEDRLKALRMRLKSHAEDVKKKLCGPPVLTEHRVQIAQIDQYAGKPVVFDATLSQVEFESQIRHLLENSMRCLDEAMRVPSERYRYTEENITDVLLVGGSTRVPLVRKMLEQRFGAARLKGMEHGIDPDEIVARGASMVAAQSDPYSEEVVKAELVDVTGHTLSVAVFEPQKGREILHPLIPKETPIPTSTSHMFSSMGDFQRQCLVMVYQGEGQEITNQTTKIGEFFIEIEPIKEPIPLEIGLQLDKNGILIAQATNRKTGQQVKCALDYKGSTQIRPEELKQRQAQLEVDLERGVGRSFNPLDDSTRSAAQAPADWAQPSRPSQPLEPAAPASSSPGGMGGTAAMNPIAQTLINKAVNNFGRIPPDRQMPVMQSVTDLQAAMQTGDQMRVMMAAGQLAKLLEDIA